MVLQILKQCAPSWVEYLTQPREQIEVALVRVPALGPGHVEERDLDEIHATLNQPTRQETPLAEQISAICVTQSFLFLIQLKGFGGCGSHQSNRSFIGRLMAQCDDSGVAIGKILLQSL